MVKHLAAPLRELQSAPFKRGPAFTKPTTPVARNINAVKK
jgi:hypothetical protein